MVGAGVGTAQADQSCSVFVSDGVWGTPQLDQAHRLPPLRGVGLLHVDVHWRNLM